MLPVLVPFHAAMFLTCGSFVSPYAICHCDNARLPASWNFELKIPKTFELCMDLGRFQCRLRW